MYEGVVQAVLRCGHCSKPFDKESSLKRHGYYCRSRRTDIVPRSRSCIPCAKKKARCDNRRPECSRCMGNRTRCQYPAGTPKGPRAGIQNRDQVSIAREGVEVFPALNPYSVGLGPTSDDGASSFLNSVPVLSTPELQDVDWHDVDIEFADFLNPKMHSDDFQHPLLAGSPHLQFSIPSASQLVQIQQALSRYNVQALILRPKMRVGGQRTANLILHTLKSYPQTLLRHDTLPPFIHPRLLSSDMDMEPLRNCVNLMHMIRTGVRGSRKLFWKNVRLECERFCEEYLSLTRWELLAAMQALSIYILLRLDEGETEHNSFDFLMLTAVTVIAKQLTYSGVAKDTSPALLSNCLEEDWKEWVFEESRRRLAVVYRTVNMLVYFEPAALCELQTDLALAPLPANKLLWETGNEFAWKAEAERNPAGIETAFGLAANGELVKFDEGQLNGHDAVLLYTPMSNEPLVRSSATWEEWCSGMDGFGGLVMLAASLLG